MTGYFEIINTSAPHIYHSALVFTPQKSIVRDLYKSHARPFTRVVHGLPMSWDETTAAATYPSRIGAAAWSPCDRFIAIAWDGTMKIEVLDPVTLQRLQTLEHLQGQPISTSPMALAFSPDSRILTCFGAGSSDRKLFVVSWDLQTGGVASAIEWQGEHDIIGTPSITYLADGRTVGVRYGNLAYDDSILVFDVASGVYMHSHSLNKSITPTNDIWTHGECLRFTTFGSKTITIWEVGLTSDAIPTEVKTLPAPEDVDLEHCNPRRPFLSLVHKGQLEEGVRVQFLPTSCRLALNPRGKVMVWDAQNSKYLLRCTDTKFQRWMTFSSDGRFFACLAVGEGVYLWKESSTGYMLHQILAFNITISCPLLSRNGESIVAFGGTTIRLWHTKRYTPPPPSSVSTQAPQTVKAFVLDFSPDGMLAAIARQGGEAVTVLNLKSGVPQLTIDTGAGVDGLGVIGNAVTVIGDGKFIAWDLPTGDKLCRASPRRNAY